MKVDSDNLPIDEEHFDNEMYLDELLNGDADEFIADAAEVERFRLRYINDKRRRQAYEEYLRNAVSDAASADLWRDDPMEAYGARKFSQTLSDLVKYAAAGIVLEVDENLIYAARSHYRLALMNYFFLESGVAERRIDADGRMWIHVHPRTSWEGISKENGKPVPDVKLEENNIEACWDENLEKKINSFQENIEHMAVTKLRKEYMSQQEKLAREERRREIERKAKEEKARAAMGWGEF